MAVRPGLDGEQVPEHDEGREEGEHEEERAERETGMESRDQRSNIKLQTTSLILNKSQ